MAWGAQCELSANVSSEMRLNTNMEYVKCRPPTYVAYRSPTRRFGAKEPPTLRHRAQTFLKRAVCDKGYPLAWRNSPKDFSILFMQNLLSVFHNMGFFLLNPATYFCALNILDFVLNKERI